MPLTAMVIEHGIDKIADADIPDEKTCHRDLRVRIIGASTFNDSSEIDTVLADIILQAAMLGEVLYG